MKMPQLSSKQAGFLALFTFGITILLTILFPTHTITLSGFLVVIFLSVFVSDRLSTIVAGSASALAVAVFMAWERVDLASTIVWSKFVFVLLLIFFSTLIVLYIKHLIRNIESHKSHLSSVFTNATEGILVTNNKGIIILANPAALKMFGYEQENDIMGQMVEILIPRRYRAGHVQLRDGFYHHLPTSHSNVLQNLLCD